MFFDNWDVQTTILTVNSRLARYLQATTDQYQKEKNHLVWVTPTILPLQTWLERQFHNVNTDGFYLLSDFQEHCVWEKIIKTSQDTFAMPAGSLAKLAQRAFELLTLWQVPQNILADFSHQPETQILQKWITDFQEHCHKKHWITRAALPAHLKQYHETLALPKTIVLMGFDEINPALNEFFSTLATCKIKHEALAATISDKKQIAFENTEAELIAMAHFAKSTLKENPQAKIGCVVPDLQNKRDTVLKIFSDIFYEDNPLPINLSAGVAMSSQQMIQTALTVLKWCHTALPIQTIYAILQSPYLCANEDEKNDGARCDAFLREKNYLFVTLPDLFFAFTSIQLSRGTFLSRWQIFYSNYQKISKNKHTPSQWAHHFLHLLQTLSWPSQHTQSSEEFQLLERFKKLMHEFAKLDALFSALPYRNALALLMKLADSTLFQAKSHQEPIQILGLLETSDMIFDTLWVSGVNNQSWPPAAKPHPLIPYAIQQRYNLPHATAKHELEFYTHITERLKKRANKIIFSYAIKEGDQQLSPSQLIHDIPTGRYAFEKIPTPAENVFLTKEMEIIDDTLAPPITDYSAIRGGTQILELQSLCPFRAFATIRLRARAFNKPQIGLSAKSKGILIHQILLAIWEELKNSAALHALSDDDLRALIKDTLNRSSGGSLSATDTNNTAFFYQIEKRRLAKLIFNWLQAEKARGEFSVFQCETAEQITIGKLQLETRIDRVDQLRDGSLLLIDYKTNSNSTNGWFQERITDLQLPLYAAFGNQNQYRGIAFAEIKSDQITFRGVIHEQHIFADQTQFELTPIDKRKNNLGINTWQNLQMTWKTALENLSEEFCSGVALINPIKPATCQTCDLKPLCRYQKETV